MKLTEKLNSLFEAKIPQDLEGRIKHVKKKGNILTFKKEDVEFSGEKRKQIVIDKVKKSSNGISLEGAKLEFMGGASAKTKVFKSEEELVDAVDWKWMNKNTMN
jgi:hypothetical protein